MMHVDMVSSLRPNHGNEACDEHGIEADADLAILEMLSDELFEENLSLFSGFVPAIVVANLPWQLNSLEPKISSIHGRINNFKISENKFRLRISCGTSIVFIFY